jgi:oligopeptide/dipeptide ABC transporter ATP-binding protein
VSSGALPAAAPEPVLEVRGLRVAYATPRGPLVAVDGVDLVLAPGESLGLVGESGCGKSTLGRGLIGLLPGGATVSGSVRLRGDELVGAPAERLRRARGGDIGLVFQEPMTRLDPLMRVVAHFVEELKAHQPGIKTEEAESIARESLVSVGIPRTRVRNHPHEFSGGMRQRIMIALALALRPGVIVADEPTTALDVVVEAQILELLDRLRVEEDLGLILITHNLGIVAETADRVAVMYAGRIVEEGPVEAVFAEPAHPYTQGLLASVISMETTELRSIDGDPPDLVDPPRGCRFRPRCPHAFAPCEWIDPSLLDVGPNHRAACLLHDPDVASASPEVP